MNRKFTLSEELLARALKSIPLGAQTFSKSYTQYPRGVSPYFLTKGKGSHVWDVDGNEYVDFINSLASITLGHGDSDVLAAVEAQLRDGTIFTLSHPLEVETAELLCEMVPCAEKVRFGKNGSDATAGAIRVARAHTGRDLVAVCGYHGWQDWYIGSTARHKGVPASVRALTHSFKFNDMESIHRLFRENEGRFAAVILEPMNTTEPNKEYLRELAEFTRKEGALLIFDETITGFRFANGGAQELFGITPDLATFGKGISNGFPLSAVAGKAQFMAQMEEIFFSFTFGGETLSLAAALATMKKLKREPVVKHLHSQGQRILESVNRLLKTNQMEDMISISGHPSWSFLNFKDCGGYSLWQVKTLFMQEVLQRGILTFGTHNMSYSHGEPELQALFNAYEEIFPLLKQHVAKGTLESALRCKPIEPLFKVR
jgi:glutamate-1-semialdehyde 2,1-aminomutase